MNLVDVDPGQLRTINLILAKRAPDGSRVLAFGSRARWAAKAYSDLDLAIDAGRKLSGDELAAIREAFEESPLPWKVDVVDIRQVPETLRDVILRDGVELSGPSRLTAGWRDLRLGDLITLKRGYDLPEAQRRPGPYPIVSSSGPSGLHAGFMAKAPGVVTGRYGTIGQVFYVAEDFWPLNTALYVSDFKGAHPSFIYYLLKTLDWSMFSDKSGVPGVNRNDVHEAVIRAPGLEEQVRIAQWLSALDDKIELNRRMNETLEGMAQAIFRDWFVDFGPVRRKIAGATDPVEIMGALTTDPAQAAKLAALFPDGFDEGGVPTGWHRSTIGNAFDLTMGQSPPGDTYNEDGVGLPFFQGRTDFGFRFPDNRKFCSQPTRIAQADDTLISVRAPVGDLNMAWEKCCIGRGVAAARHRSGYKSYTFCALRSIQPELELFENSGTVFGAINKKQFEKLAIIEPSHRAVSAFEELAGSLDDRLRVSAAENRTLAETRDYLLPRLMSGAVRVGEATVVAARQAAPA